MQTPRFWYPTPNDRSAALKAELLQPFSYFFKAGTKLRRKFASPYYSRVPVLCVGNVVAGGAGKTPTALALGRMLRRLGKTPAFVTRGYGGSGVLTQVDPARHTVRDVGDEALLLAAEAPTWACSDRAEALRQAEQRSNVIVMDDGFQNPNITPTASFLVVDGEVGIGNGRIIPAGPLREPFEEALGRAAAVLIVGKRDRQKLAGRIKKIPVFRAHLEPRPPPGFSKIGRYVAFAGLARPEKFFATAQELGLDIASARQYPDHYPYGQGDIDALRLEAEVLGARLLTTEKDAVRLPPDFRSEVITLPVELVFDGPRADEDMQALLLASLRHIRN